MPTHLKSFLIFFISLYLLQVSAQNKKLLQKWSKEDLERANTAKDVNYLSEEEKNVIFLINLARLNGELFTETFLDDFIKKNRRNKKSSYIKSLYKDLKRIKNIPPLIPYKKLYETAKHHALDMGKTGKIGHNSSDGTKFSTRLRKHARGSFIAENCSYGYSDALGIVMQLLIDENTPSLGHRKNILNPKYKSVGVSIEKHKRWSYNCVQDFSDFLPQK